MVSLVGVGPGDPGLLTLRAQRAIARADTVMYDALVHPGVLRHARRDAEMLFVGKRKGHESTTQDEINHMLLYRAGQGRRVARLKGGDPFLFGRGAEEAEFLAAHGVDFEVVPGVTAALGALAYAGIPISHRDLSSSIALVTATERPDKPDAAVRWERLADATQTLVLYMGLSRLRETLSALVSNGRDPETPAAVVAWGTHPEQRVVVATVETLADKVERSRVTAPALVVVGEVVRLRETLRWWDRGPLSGRSVVVTRAKEQSASMVDALAAEGATVIEQPVIRVEPAPDPAAVARAVWAVAHGAYEAVAFTSGNAVTRFFEAIEAAGRDARALGRCLVAAIGPATAEALRGVGVKPDLVPSSHVGEDVADELLWALGERARGARVLLPRAETARETLPAALRKAGCDVDIVAVYRTVAVEGAELGPLREALAKGEVDAVTFTSGSTAQRLCEALGRDARALLSNTTVASIGPTTTRVAEALGLRVDVEADAYTAEGLIDALRRHFQRSQRDDA
ncbi:MAG: uroporphyrinogen-III C-methyltransferase [Polyangiales bacterium]